MGFLRTYNNSSRAEFTKHRADTIKVDKLHRFHPNNRMLQIIFCYIYLAKEFIVF